MANTTYRLSYVNSNSVEYRSVTNASGTPRKFTGIKGARAFAYRLLLENPSIERVMVTKGKYTNYFTGSVKRGNGAILWTDSYYIGSGRTRLLNKDGSIGGY